MAICCTVKLQHAGDGLATSSAVRNQYHGISDAGLFFEQVLSKPYVNQVYLILLVVLASGAVPA